MTHDKAHRAAVVAKLSEQIERLSNRPCPVLRHQKGTGQAYVAFRLHDTRRTLYFGPWGSEKAAATYARFAKSWPAPLMNTPPPRPQPGPRLLTHDGRTQTLTAWAREVGLKSGTLRHRLDVEKWSIGCALTTPARGVSAVPRMCRDTKGRAFVRWSHGRGQRLTLPLGAWGSAAAEAAYGQFLERWKRGKT